MGLELIGLHSQSAAHQETGDNVPVGHESDVFEARDAGTWQPESHHLEFRHPSITDAQSCPIGPPASATPPQFLGRISQHYLPLDSLLTSKNMWFQPVVIPS